MMYYESKTWGKFCERAFGSDLKQVGMVTDEELAVFLREAAVPFGSTALDLGFGAGFMSKRIAEALDMHVVGINVEPLEVDFAKEHFKDNPKLSFMQMDFNDMNFPLHTQFDLIYSLDTLYFTFSIEALHSLLDTCMALLKPGGKLAVFWTNMPKTYPMDSPEAQLTQVGVWAKNHDIPYRAFDFTKSHWAFWINGLQHLKDLEPEFLAEGYTFYDKHVNEYTLVSDLCEKGEIFRWLYVFEKSKEIV